ncbi:HIG1 domain-containing protein [Novosphingobium sp. 1949]|uniref:HIG1 domain-containing protein n=1 Tax=Novosphingobium organovorum TaxID=2930092 RepID=A0ABT0BF49_9SPHN|nr:HIG1 domain-containing protein [Novosphingobium organovorum]MCJ2183682.1 HIG1 domain-containing protein [Novosphingobium organovorum]
MKVFFALVIVALMIGVVISLVRGIVAFLQSTKEDLNRAPGETGPTRSQEMQNRMMFNRIKFQALAVFACVILLAIAH